MTAKLGSYTKLQNWHLQHLGGGGYTGLTKQRDAPAGIPPFMLYNVGQKRHPTDTVNKREGGYVPPRATANAR